MSPEEELAARRTSIYGMPDPRLIENTAQYLSRSQNTAMYAHVQHYYNLHHSEQAIARARDAMAKSGTMDPMAIHRILPGRETQASFLTKRMTMAHPKLYRAYQRGEWGGFEDIEIVGHEEFYYNTVMSGVTDGEVDPFHYVDDSDISLDNEERRIIYDNWITMLDIIADEDTD